MGLSQQIGMELPVKLDLLCESQIMQQAGLLLVTPHNCIQGDFYSVRAQLFLKNAAYTTTLTACYLGTWSQRGKRGQFKLQPRTVCLNLLSLKSSSK